MTDPHTTNNRQEENTSTSTQIDIAGFELMELLGEGGHGRVYKALCKPLNRVVAVKIMADDYSPGPNKNLERIQNEAKILARLNHPNIVQVFQVGFTNSGKAFFVSEFLNGKTLDKVLEETESLSDAQIKAIVLQVSDALAFLHENGLVHRDIKPSNIMLMDDVGSKYFQVKLLDFGLTREFIDGDTNSSTTRTGTMLGTPVYMSPEQCKGQKLDARSDLYSLACVCFQCVFGKTPFEGESAWTVQYKHINEEVGSIEQIKANPHDSLAIFFSKGLAKDPALRPKNAQQYKEEFLEALRRRGKNPPIASWNNTKKLIAIAAIVLVAPLGVFVGSLLGSSFVSKQNSEPEPFAGSLKDNSKVLAGTALRRASPDSELRALIELYKPRLYYQQSKTEHQKSCGEILARLNDLSPRIKKDVKMLFAASYLRSKVLADLDRPKEEREAMLDALAACRIDDKNEYLQAANCYIRLASIEQLAHHYDQAYVYAKKAEKILQMQKDDKQIKTMDLPSSLKYIVAPLWLDVPLTLASLEENRKNYSKAIEYYRQASPYGIREYGTAGEVPSQVGIANLLDKQGKTQESRKLMLNLMQQVEKEATNSSGGDLRQAQALWLIGNWFYKRNERDVALRCLAIIREKQKAHSLIDPYLSKSFNDFYEELRSTGSLKMWDDGSNIFATR